jgi:hypothetical protein
MSYTAEQLAALKVSVARGTKSVSYDGQTVTYHSLAEMLHLIAVIERELNPTRARVSYPEFTRGT